MSAAIVHDASWFLFKFSAIPEDEWCVGEFCEYGAGGKIRHCALGHCGVSLRSESVEGHALAKALNEKVGAINDGSYPEFSALGKTPKARILAALRQAKAEGR